MREALPVNSNVSVALIHYPVYDKNRQVVSTAVTNLDIHDIARSARTFGVSRYYVVTPVQGQQELAKRIVRHWQEGWGATYNPKRKAALDLIEITASLDDAIADIQRRSGRMPRLVTTGAGQHPRSARFADLRVLMTDREQPYLLLFGTGWGLVEEVFDRADMVLEPIRGVGDYNHLSVRSAAAIIMDRLFGAS
ncbi:RNA methyltransferase [Geobacter benzoatilyticus]|uniref:RNA methyltransferase n=1 Tax=Geobacter benzoatilyticus TaxID=2815309 RepID=A0ABX7Q3T9_9BACT|nr:RNA methyltransferase [Geobacter benzoatilyticus]QSV46121.1 RNA methyltransferase [Geobacter benzoatilyticus]